MANLPVNQDLTIYKGQAWNRNLRFEYEKSGDTYDLTGFLARAQIRARENADALVAEFIVNVVGSEGLVSLALTHQQTEQLLPGVYYWDLKLTKPNDQPKYWIRGKVHIIGRVTE